MATTSPDNLRTPDPGDPYNLVPDLATLANDVQAALITRGNAYRGAVSERTAFTSTATPGMLWQDTGGIKMIWRKGASAWEPAVWRWSGTTTQMNSFTQAPNGFEWFSTTDKSKYLRLDGNWRRVPVTIMDSGSVTIPGGSGTVTSKSITFQPGLFTEAPVLSVTAFSTVPGTVEEVSYAGASTTGATIYVRRTNSTDTIVRWVATQIL